MLELCGTKRPEDQEVTVLFPLGINRCADSQSQPSEFVLCALLFFVAEITSFHPQDAQIAINGLNGMPLKTFLVQLRATNMDTCIGIGLIRI
jgi:hypothetical protein